MSLVKWVVDRVAGQDTVDLYFVLSDLADIQMSEAELAQTAHYDAGAGRVEHQHRGDDSNIPIGKRVY